MTHKLISALLVSLLVLLATTGEAKAKPTKQEMKEAKALFQKAEAFAAKKEYVPSAEYYLRAHKLFPSTDFIFNAAAMFRLADDKENARIYFQQYLSLDPKGRGAAEATSALALYDAEDKAARERELAAKRDQEAKAAKDKKDQEASENKGAELEKSEGSDKGQGRSLRLPAILTMSAGGLLVGVGVYFTLESRSISKEVSDSQTFDPDLEKEGREASRNAYIFGGLGAAVIVGGAIIYVLGGDEKSEKESLSFAPAITGDSVGAFAFGEF